MNTASIAAIAATAALGAATHAAEVRTVYREWFDHYQERTPAFNAGTTVKETGVSESKGLVFAPAKGELARRGFFHVGTPPRAGDWTFAFQYRAENAESVGGSFVLRLYFGDEARPSTADFAVPLNARYMTKAFVTVSGGKATLHVFDQGVQKAVATQTPPTAPLIGWNVAGAGDKPAKTIMTGVMVVDGSAKPWFPGDPTEWLAALPPKTPPEIPADFGTMLSNDKKLVRELDLDRNDAEFKFMPSEAGNSALVFRLPDGAKHGITFQWRNETPGRGSPLAALYGLPNAGGPVFTNEMLLVSGDSFFYPLLYSRPRIASRYQEAEVAEIRAQFDRMPRPSEKVWDIALRRDGNGANALYVDGVFALSFTNGPVVGVSASLAEGAQLAVREVPAKRDAFVERLDFRRWPEGFPLWRCRENRGSAWLGSYGYAARSAFEAMPDSCFFEVPRRPYVKARARCRVSTDVPADYEPVVVARLWATYKHTSDYGRTAVRVERKAVLPRPGEAPAKQQGVALKDLGDGLWEVTFDLDVGSIFDAVYGNDPLNNDQPFRHLDFEFTGVLWRQCNTYVNQDMMPDREARSSVVVLGGELVAPFTEFQATPKHPFSTYYEGETPASTVRAVNRTRGNASMTIRVTDEKGKPLQDEKFVFGPGETNKVFEFKPRDPGWYGVEYRCGEIVHKASYAVVPADDRTATYDSPYNAWTHFGVHGTCHDVELNYDLLKRLGIRSTGLITSWTKTRDENDPLLVKYGLRHQQFTWSSYIVRPKEGQSDEEAIEEKAKELRVLRARYPHTNRALIFHESGFGPFPWEIVGGKSKLTAQDYVDDTNRVRTAVLTAKAWRKAAPDVKLVWGNSVDSLPLLARVFRSGVPRDLIDFLGEETVGCMTPPEYVTARAPWMQRKLAEVMGYGKIPSDAPFEWKFRNDRNFKDPDRQLPDYHTRDALIALAIGYSMVPTPAGIDVSSSYVDSIWGSGYTHRRWPLGYPKRNACSVATLTSVFDKAKFQALLPTDSLTVYAPMFTVRDGARHATALWCARGETRVRLDLGENADYELVSMMGARQKGQTAAEIPVTESPCYVLTAKPLVSAKVCAKRTFPNEAVPAGAKSVVAVPLASADEVEIVPGMDPRLEVEDDSHDPRRAGMFTVATVKDDEKGDCVEIRDETGETPELMMNCAFMRFPNAKPVDGDFDTIGVWVNGNSSWGRLFFEVTDAEGEVWMSTGPGGYRVCEYDWPCQASISFDGWHFVQFPMRGGSHVWVRSPSMNQWQWTRDGERGNGKIDFPVRVTGLGYGNYQWAIDLLEMRPTRPTLRFKDVTLLRSE